MCLASEITIGVPLHCRPSSTYPDHYWSFGFGTMLSKENMSMLPICCSCDLFLGMAILVPAMFDNDPDGDGEYNACYV